MQLTRRQLFAATAALGLPAIRTAEAMPIPEIPEPQDLVSYKRRHLNMLFGPKKDRMDMIRTLYLAYSPPLASLRPEIVWKVLLVPVYEQHRDYVLQERKKRGQNVGEYWMEEEVLDDYVDICTEVLEPGHRQRYLVTEVTERMGDIAKLLPRLRDLV
jgi:hypothetical protein